MKLMTNQGPWRTKREHREHIRDRGTKEQAQETQEKQMNQQKVKGKHRLEKTYASVK